MKKLLVLGGANLHVKVVKTAKEMGIYTIVTDYLNDSPAKDIADKSYNIDVKDIDSIVDMCRKEKVDGVIGPYIDPCQRPYYQICHRIGVPCYIDTWEQVFTLTDKVAFKKACIKNGVDIIPTFNLAHPESIVYPVLVKPGESRGSRGQTICESEDELKEAIKLAETVSDNGKAIIEKYMGNKNDFSMTYIFADGKAYITRTSDRYLGDADLHLEKVGIGTVSPSYFTQKYIKGVHRPILKMLRDLNIKNGPVFMQGFVDGDTVRFYDPGYRFPGSEFDIMFERVWGINIIKMMIEFALTGRMDPEHKLEGKNLTYLKGKSIVTLFPAMKSGKIAQIKGLKEIEAMPEVAGYTLRHHVGDMVSFTGDVNQRLGEFDIIGENYLDLIRAITAVQDVLHVLDENGNELLFGNLDIGKIKTERIIM